MDWIQFLGPSFKLRIPSNWVAASSPDFQTMFISPIIEGKERANLTIFMQAYEPSQSLDTLIETMAGSQAKAYPEYQVHHEGEVTNESKLPIYYRVYEFTSPTNGSRILQTQAFLRWGDIVYILMSARSSTMSDDKAEIIDSIFAEMLNSFVFEEASI